MTPKPIDATMAVDLGRYRRDLDDETQVDPAEAARNVEAAVKIIEAQRSVALNIDRWGKAMRTSFKGILTNRERIRFLRSGLSKADD